MQFAAISSFPNVNGTIDCTHVAIKAPSDNSFAFVNWKHYSSINVEMICNADIILSNVGARWPASTYDPFISRHSSVRGGSRAGVLYDGWLPGKFCLISFEILFGCSPPLQMHTLQNFSSAKEWVMLQTTTTESWTGRLSKVKRKSCCHTDEHNTSGDNSTLSVTDQTMRK